MVNLRKRFAAVIRKCRADAIAAGLMPADISDTITEVRAEKRNSAGTREDPLSSPHRIQQAIEDYENGQKNYHFHDFTRNGLCSR